MSIFIILFFFFSCAVEGIRQWRQWQSHSLQPQFFHHDSMCNGYKKYGRENWECNCGMWSFFHHGSEEQHLNLSTTVFFFFFWNDISWDSCYVLKPSLPINATFCLWHFYSSQFFCVSFKTVNLFCHLVSFSASVRFFFLFFFANLCPSHFYFNFWFFVLLCFVPVFFLPLFSADDHFLECYLSSFLVRWLLTWAKQSKCYGWCIEAPSPVVLWQN